MTQKRISVVLFALFFWGSLENFVASHSLEGQSQNAARAIGVAPILRLEKPKYLLGESVRFWVGVEPKNSSVIPPELQRPCSLEIAKPNGSTETQSVGWPIDGMTERGWSGGWGFRDTQMETGSYTLVLDCVGERTKPLELMVERNDVIDQIRAEFRFERSGMIKMNTSVPVLLTVQDNSPDAIQFPQRGAMSEGVSLKVIRERPALHSDFFYPWKKLASSTISPDTYTWDVASAVPSVDMKPGEHFEQRFVLDEAYSFDQPGNYEVTFSTVLSVLVGEKRGPFADFCPIRLPVVAAARFTVADAK
jgi:hypothetical protein